MFSSRVAVVGILLALTAGAHAQKTLDDPHFDKAMYDAFAVTCDLELACTIANFSANENPTGSLGGIPAEVTTRLAAAKKSLEATKAVHSADPKRESARDGMVAYMTSMVSASTLLADAFTEAATGKSWTTKAKDLLQKSNDAYSALTKANQSRAFRELVQTDTDFRARCPQELEFNVGLGVDPTGFVLGVNNFTDQKTTVMAMVPKNLLAYSLGFRSRDTLKSFNGKPVSDMLSFKKMLKEATGQKAEAVVARNGKDQTIAIDVPANLALFDNDPESTKVARRALQSLLDGKLDRTLFTPEFAKKITTDTEEQIRKQLNTFGKLTEFTFRGGEPVEDLVMRAYAFTLGSKRLAMNVFTNKQGIIDQLLIGEVPPGG